MLSKDASSTIFWVFGMTRPGIEPRSPGPMANTLAARPMSGIIPDGIIYTFIRPLAKIMELAHVEDVHLSFLARLSLILSRHFSQSFIASGRSSGLYPVSSHSCCMYVRASRPTFAQSYVGVHRSTSLLSSSLLLQQCPACLVCLAWIVFVLGGRWPYSWCLVGCCR